MMTMEYKHTPSTQNEWPIFSTEQEHTEGRKSSVDQVHGSQKSQTHSSGEQEKENNSEVHGHGGTNDKSLTVHRHRGQPSFEKRKKDSQSTAIQPFVGNAIRKDRHRSQPPKNCRTSTKEDISSKRNIVMRNFRSAVRRSSSSDNIAKIHGSKHQLGWTGDSNNNFGGVQMTRHTLYKEAMYTCVHMLGAASFNRFPASQEELCLYTHEAFCASYQEQVAVLEHVRSEPFPLTIVNTKVRRAQGLQSSKPNSLVDSYCLVNIEAEHSIRQREWQKFSLASPLRSKILEHNKKNLKPTAENRTFQIYEKIPQFVKTGVQRHQRNPEWEQRFQCLSLRPSVDCITVEARLAITQRPNL
ncbi:unnamed protein product [Orchesella dallaii]|uniref:C2 domain-containing protein n=1 Tax=Orchesella dallaii TaxID=48710 RepID=A0ABP1R976_9HEXA